MEGKKRKGKSLWKSYTFWVTVISIVAMVVNRKLGVIAISPEDEKFIVGTVAILLRLITGEPIDWGATIPVRKKGEPV